MQVYNADNRARSQNDCVKCQMKFLTVTCYITLHCRRTFGFKKKDDAIIPTKEKSDMENLSEVVCVQ